VPRYKTPPRASGNSSLWKMSAINPFQKMRRQSQIVSTASTMSTVVPENEKKGETKTRVVPLKHITNDAAEYGTPEELLAFDIDPAEERALRRAIDWQVGPIVMIL